MELNLENARPTARAKRERRDGQRMPANKRAQRSVRTIISGFSDRRLHQASCLGICDRATCRDRVIVIQLFVCHLPRPRRVAVVPL